MIKETDVDDFLLRKNAFLVRPTIADSLMLVMFIIR